MPIARCLALMAVLVAVLALRSLVPSPSAAGAAPTRGVHLLPCPKPCLINVRGTGRYNNFYEVRGRVHVGAGTIRKQSFVAPPSFVVRWSHTCPRSVHTFSVTVLGYDGYHLFHPPFTAVGPYPLVVSENPKGNGTERVTIPTIHRGSHRLLLGVLPDGVQLHQGARHPIDCTWHVRLSR